MTENMEDTTPEQVDEFWLEDEDELDTHEDTIRKRQPLYGDFSINAEITDMLLRVCERSPNWSKAPAWMRQAIRMICAKLGRMLSGSMWVSDNAHDIGGYAALMEERIEERNNANACANAQAAEVDQSNNAAAVIRT